MWNINRFMRSVAKSHSVQVNFLSALGAGLAVNCTLVLELYTPAAFLDTTVGEATGVVGLTTVAELIGFCLVGVSRPLRIFGSPFVSCSAFTTSAGKFSMIFTFARCLSRNQWRN